MNSKVAVREIMKKKGVGTAILAKETGKLPQNINDMLNLAKGIHFTTGKLSDLLDVLGYKIVLMPKEVEVQEEWYEIDSEVPNITKTTTPGAKDDE